MFLREYEVRSAAARRELAVVKDVRYGPRADETLDYLPQQPPGRARPRLRPRRPLAGPDQGRSAFPAHEFVAAGVGYVAVNYGLAPAVSLDEMVAIIRRCVRWLLAHADELGLESRTRATEWRFGEHLVAMGLTPTSPVSSRWPGRSRASS